MGNDEEREKGSARRVEAFRSSSRTRTHFRSERGPRSEIRKDRIRRQEESVHAQYIEKHGRRETKRTRDQLRHRIRPSVVVLLFLRLRLRSRLRRRCCSGSGFGTSLVLRRLRRVDGNERRHPRIRVRVDGLLRFRRCWFRSDRRSSLGLGRVGRDESRHGV